ARPVVTAVTGVRRGNLAPFAGADAATTPQGQPVTIPVLANDADPDGNGLVVTAVDVPAHGTAEVVSAGTAVRYAPARDFVGVETFRYTVSDGEGGTSRGTVRVTVTQVNRPPVAVDDRLAAVEDASVVLD